MKNTNTITRKVKGNVELELSTEMWIEEKMGCGYITTDMNIQDMLNAFITIRGSFDKKDYKKINQLSKEGYTHFWLRN